MPKGEGEDKERSSTPYGCIKGEEMQQRLEEPSKEGESKGKEKKKGLWIYPSSSLHHFHVSAPCFVLRCVLGFRGSKRNYVCRSISFVNINAC